MSKKTTREVLDELVEKNDRLLIAVIGDEKLGIEGMVKKQEGFDKRLKKIEHYFIIFHGFSKIKRGTILVFGSLFALLTTVVTFWEKIVGIIK
jgi:hypothetical protein